MFMRSTPRKTYRDIADGFDRMGNAGWGYAPPGFAPPGWAPAVAGMVPTDPSCGLGECCTPPVPAVSRLVVAGLPNVCIGACDCETIETSICAPFELTNLYISPKIASCLSITRFRIGCWDLLVNCDPVPAELFSCCELDENQFRARPMDANSPICLTVENECDDDVKFSGAIKGLFCDAC